jgi:N-acetylglucosamine kinase-like BadF-type ATPase
MTSIINKSRIRELVREFDKENSVTSVAEEVERELEKKVEELIINGIKRAKANQRRTLLARDL